MEDGIFIPTPLFAATVQYLTGQPYREVAKLLSALQLAANSSKPSEDVSFPDGPVPAAKTD